MFSKVEAIDLDKVLKANFDKGKFCLDRIAIPSVKLNLPIYKGLANGEYLLSGAGTARTKPKDG